jgi:uncharacterized protein
MPSRPIQLPFRVGSSPGLNIRGLIAVREIRKGSLIEKCPVILIRRGEESAIQRTALRRYYCEWDERYYCIVLGYGSLLNHSFAPNARYRHDDVRQLFVITAIRRIRPGEEITINYNYHPDSSAPLKPYYLDYDRHRPRG